MRIKTARDLVSSLRGSAFRRVTCDSRSWFVREIRTVGNLFGRGRAEPESHTLHARRTAHTPSGKDVA
jgi:hypothetical protein